MEKTITIKSGEYTILRKQKDCEGKDCQTVIMHVPPLDGGTRDATRNRAVKPGISGSGRDLSGRIKKAMGTNVGEDHMAKLRELQNQVKANERAMKDVAEEAKRVLRQFQSGGKSNVDWKNEIQKWADRIAMELDSEFPNRRFVGDEIYVQGYREKELTEKGFTEVVVAIDTSCSISEEQSQAFITELMSILGHFEIEKMHIIYCSDNIDGVDTFEPIEDEVPDFSVWGTTKGNANGFIPPFQWVQENLDAPPMLFIYMNDSWAHYPTRRSHGIDEYDDRVLWFILRNTAVTQLDSDRIPPFGEYMVFSMDEFNNIAGIDPK